MGQGQHYFNELLRLRRQKPFHPFTIITATGGRHKVMEFARFATNGADIVVIGAKDRMSHFRMDDIVSIEEDAPVAG